MKSYVPIFVINKIQNKIEEDGFAIKGKNPAVPMDLSVYVCMVTWPNLKHKIYEAVRFFNCNWPSGRSLQYGPANGNKVYLWKNVKKYLDVNIAPMCKSKWSLEDLK